MLYVFHGTDTSASLAKTQAFVEMLRRKQPDAEVFRFDEDTFSPDGVRELAYARGLFVEKHLVVLRGVLGSTAYRESLIALCSTLKESPNVFVLHEGKLDAALKREVGAHADKVEECAEKGGGKPSFNIFALGDALGTRDRRLLWTLYVKALRAGHEPEELHGTLFWAVKSMLLASSTTSAEEAGQKPFVWGKFNRYAKAYTKEELTGLSRDLVELYHEAHRGRYPLETALERWVLAR